MTTTMHTAATFVSITILVPAKIRGFFVHCRGAVLTPSLCAAMLLAGIPIGCDPRPSNPTSPKTETSPGSPQPSTATHAGTNPGFQLTRIAEFPRPESLNAMAFSPDGRFLALACGESTSVGSRGLLALWDLKENKQVHRTGSRDAYRHVGFAPDGERIITASNYEVHVWGLSDWKRTSMGGRWGYISKLALSQDGRMIAIAGRLPIALTPPGIIAYDLTSGNDLRTFRGEFINAVAFNPDGSILAAGSDTDITLWSTKTWNVEATFSPPVTAPKAACPVTISGLSVLDNSVLVDVFTQVHLWDQKERKVLWSVPDVTAAVSNDSRRLVLVAWDGKTKTRSLILRDLPAEEPVAIWNLGDRYPYSLTLSPKGDRVAWVEINEKDHAADKVFVYGIGQ